MKALRDTERILKARSKKYPPYRDENNRLVQAYTALFPDGRITGDRVPLLMVQMKLIREADRHHRDSVIDAMGYLTRYDELNGHK